MKKNKTLISVVATAALAFGGMATLSAEPAAASAPPYCTLTVTAPGTDSCEFNGVGPVGTYSVTVVGGSATLTVNCGDWFIFSTTSSRAGNYQRGALMNTCSASLTSTGTAAAATLT